MCGPSMNDKFDFQKNTQSMGNGNSTKIFQIITELQNQALTSLQADIKHNIFILYSVNFKYNML